MLLMCFRRIKFASGFMEKHKNDHRLKLQQSRFLQEFHQIKLLMLKSQKANANFSGLPLKSTEADLKRLGFIVSSTRLIALAHLTPLLSELGQVNYLMQTWFPSL